MSASLPHVRPVIFAAFRAGGFAAVRLRPSRRSPSGVVAACGFADLQQATRFAVTCRRRYGARPLLRVVAGFWVVSVPVAGSVPFRGPTAWWVRGGLRRVSAVAAAASRALL